MAAPLALLLLPPLLLAGSPCSSSIAVDDVDTEQCFGWCSPLSADAHCQWCKCRGCEWCAGLSRGDQPVSLPSSISRSSPGPVECETTLAGEPAVHDCQGFCTAAASVEHCPLCKCKACSFCKCSSEHEDDSVEELCEPWCTADYYADHCSRCKCRACDFCKTGPPCSSTIADDIKYEACEEFCDPKFYSQHCPMCKCKGCDFCKAPPSTGTCNSGIVDDLDYETCEDFCTDKHKGDHCALCKCRSCDFCSCSSSHEGDSLVEECQPWCNGDYIETHCDFCACKGCRFCRVGGKDCHSFYLTGDLDHEACEPFCNERSKETHCSMCKCKQCGFCKADELASLPASSGSGSGGGPACFSGFPHDSDTEKCEGFCRADRRKEHCGQCKCKGCSFCGEVCTSGIPGDSDVVGCSPSCALNEASAVCPLCKCRGCAFCDADGKVSQVGVRAKEQAEEEARSRPGGCIPANSQDSDVEQCMAHCVVEKKASQCGTCSCRSCDFCHGFLSCDSGERGDVSWVACEDDCDSPHDCERCGCRACEHCRLALAQKGESCHSGIIGDTPTRECIVGLCHASDRAAHCQTCRCQGCSWCSEPPSPPPSPVSASGALPQCHSGHIGDALESKCEPWCTSHSLSSALVCELCACKACGRCRNLHLASPHAPLATSAPGEAGCPLALELSLLGSKREEADSVMFELNVRPSEWHSGAVVTVDFSGTTSKVNVDRDDVTAADLTSLSPPGGAFEHSFRLGSKPGTLRGFSFTAFTDRDDLNQPRPRLRCSHVPGRPPPPSSLPPNPPVAPSPQHQCVLGGKFVLGQVWSAGSSFRAQVVLAVWRPNAFVTLDFRKSAAPNNVAGLGATNAEKASVVKAPYPGSIRVSLGPEPGPQNSFSIIAHGGNIGMRPPQILCSLPGAAPAGSGEKAPVIDESCSPLTPLYQLLNVWQGGFKAAVAIAKWQPGATLTLKYNSFSPQLLNTWSARGAVADGGLAFTLDATADPQYNGLTFTARGDPAAAAAPTISCIASKVTAASVDVPAAACGLGAAYSILPEGEASPETKISGKGVWRVRVRVHQWEPHARLELTFSPAVSVYGNDGVSLVGGAPGELSSLHAMELDAHPNAQHGLAFSIRTETGSQPPSLVKLSCRPPLRAGEKTVPTGIVAGVAEAPAGLSVLQASCNHLEIAWQPSIDNGLRVTRYTVAYRREDAAEEDEATLDVETTAVVLNGLAGGTAYLVRVRAHNAKGASAFSQPLVAATDGGGAPLVAPVAPNPYRSLDCASVAFELPTLRSGCRGDSFFTVEGRSLVRTDILLKSDDQVLKPYWTVLIPRAAASTVVLRSLAPYDAAEYRITAHNKDGASPSSDVVGPLLTDSDTPALLHGPKVIATSSASFALTWDDLTGDCRARMRWRIEWQRNATAMDSPWEEMETNVEGSGYQAFPVRCPLPGCSFRVVPIGLRGLEDPSAPSPPAVSPALPLIHSNAVRLQLKFVRAQTSRDLNQLKSLAARELVAQLRVDRAALEVQDCFGRGQFLVIDLFGAPQLGAEAANVPASELAQQLEAVLEDLSAFALGHADLGKELDGAAGVQMLLPDGRLTRVHVTPAARAASSQLPRPPRLLSPNAAAAAGFTLVVGVALLAAFFSGTCIRQAMTVARLPTGAGRYGRLATRVVDAGEEGGHLRRGQARRVRTKGQGQNAMPARAHDTLELDH